MATSKSLSKMRVASRVCKLGAWVIAALGMIAVVLYAFAIVQLFSALRGYQGGAYQYGEANSMISVMFLIVVPTLFFSIILYAMGTLIEHISSETKVAETTLLSEEEDDDGRLEIVPIPEMR